VTTILLVRHGETDWNAERRWQGHADRPLNDVGRRQARALAARLDDDVDAVYSSDLARARETAEILGERLGLPVRLDARLREVDVGEWSGLTTAEVEARFPGGLAQRRNGRTGWREGETYEAMGERVLEALHEIAAVHDDGRVVVVTHGGPIRAVWLASGVAPDRPGAANCDVAEIAVEGDEVTPIDSASGGGLHQQVQR
jgi:probable phosphoglycerate mutase